MSFFEAWKTPDGKGTALVLPEDIVYDSQGRPKVSLDLQIFHEILEQAGYVNISDEHPEVAR